MKCLAKSAEERYQTGFQLADALQSYLSSAATADVSRLAFYARHTGATATATDL
jgi:hypothetical protein